MSINESELVSGQNRALVTASGALVISNRGKNVSEGDIPLLVSPAGRQVSSVSGTSVADASVNPARGLMDSADSTSFLASGEFVYNNASWDRRRGNVGGTLLSLAARTATIQSSDIINYNGMGVIAYLNVTVASGTGGLTLQFLARDPESGSTFQLNTNPAAVIAVGKTAYMLYPGISGGGIIQATSLALPRVFLVQVSHGDATSYTYQVGYHIIGG